MVRKRARNEEGRFVADDKSTPYINEAYEVTFMDRVRQFFWIPPHESISSFVWRFLVWLFKG